MRGKSRCWVVALVTVIGVTSGPPTPADAGGDRRPTPPDWLVVEDGVSQPQFAFEDAITEQVRVQTTVDSDLDGALDRLGVTVFRPRETATLGIDVPVIFEHSPYRFGTGNAENHPVDVDLLPQDRIRPHGAAPHAGPDLSVGSVEFWVSRGYAVVLGESVGTGSSDGCPTVGDRTETLATRAVIDWLNGRAKAWNENGAPVRAGWTTGDVGMIGVSYDGTLANMVATTGVAGLRTIVPISAIASWYDYYRANGLVRAPHSAQSGTGTNFFQGEDIDVLATFTQGPSRLERCREVTERLVDEQDRTTGDYSSFWHDRDYLHRADGIRSSVFVVHGLEDYNVMPTAYASWWSRLERHRVPRKLWLHSEGHGGPPDAARFQHALNRWFDYWLFGVDNGVRNEPRVDVERPDGTRDRYRDWPVPGTDPVRFQLTASAADRPGGLDAGGRPDRSAPRQTFVDRGRELDTDSALISEPDVAHPNRLAYLSDELVAPVHLSGTPRVSLRAAIENRYSANLTAVLVDYGPAGESAPVVVTRGWADPQNRHGAGRSVPLEQGKEYRITWDLEPDDYVFPAGHRIGLIVVSTDFDYTFRPLPGTRLVVNPAHSQLWLPIDATTPSTLEAG
jgi:X-Pro dipeptidyl-peptidase